MNDAKTKTKATHKFHRLADIYPLMRGEPFDALKADIAENGLRESIVLHEGQIVDGRNRYRACLAVGVDPRFREWDRRGELVSFVASMNSHRRDLTPSQRAMVGVALEKEFAKLAKERQRAAGGDKKSPAAKKSHTQRIGGAVAHSGEAAEQAAKAAGTNRSYVSVAKKLAKENPKLARMVHTGEVSILQAQRRIKIAERDAIRQTTQESIDAAPTIQEALAAAKFSTIVVDPPWDWKDEGDNSQLGRGKTTYGGMSFDELLEFPVGDYADDDAHVYLWITNRSLPKGFPLLEAWGFRYVTMLTWCKPSFGMGNYFRGSTEHLLFGVKGSQPLKRKNVGTWFEARRGGKQHSAKPDEAYALIESCSPGPYVDIFARKERPGWTCWGGEL